MWVKIKPPGDRRLVVFARAPFWAPNVEAPK